VIHFAHKILPLLFYNIFYDRLPDLVVNAAHSAELQELKEEADDLDEQASQLWEVDAKSPCE